MVKSQTYIATPPGATIKEQLKDRGMTQKEFAARMNMSEKHISKLVNGEVQLTPETAVKLEIVLGAPARFWNNLEAIYQEKKIKAEEENNLDADADLAKKFPYHEMSRFRWVPETRDKKEMVYHLRRYFEVVKLSLLGSEQITKIAYRRLAITEKGDLAVMAWVQEAKLKARDIPTSTIDIKKLNNMISEIRKLTVLKPDYFCPRMTKLFSECGIALVFLPHLKGSFLQGATFIEGNKIVVGLTVRGKDADKFWFSLFHELAHIILGHIDQADGTSEEDEQAADSWAKDILIPQTDFDVFKEAGDYSELSIVRFAKEESIAPGIVVGRLQREGIIEYSMYNNLKEKYEIVLED